MKGISPVIAIVLMLVIIIALAGTAYLYISGVFTGKVATSFSIVESYNDTITIRNDGTNPITSFTKVTLDGNPATYLVIPQDPGLVGYWKFDEGSGTTAKDTSGNGNDGELKNGPEWVDGKFGKALSFDGVDNYVEVPHSPSLNITGEITVAAWINPLREVSHSIVYHVLVSKTPDYLRGYNLAISYKDRPNSFHFLINLAGDRLTYVIPAYNKWYHVVAVADSISKRLYVNGVLVDTKSAEAIPENTEPLRIGGGIENRYSLGLVDEVRIYNRALSAEEIKASFNIGSIVNPGQTATIKIYNIPSKGTHTVRLCTSSMCTTGYLTII